MVQFSILSFFMNKYRRTSEFSVSLLACLKAVAANSCSTLAVPKSLLTVAEAALRICSWASVRIDCSMVGVWYNFFHGLGIGNIWGG